MSDEDWNKCFTTNVMAHLWLMQAVKEELKKNSGAFVISASVAGLRPGGSSMVRTRVSRAGELGGAVKGVRGGGVERHRERPVPSAHSPRCAPRWVLAARPRSAPRNDRDIDNDERHGRR